MRIWKVAGSVFILSLLAGCSATSARKGFSLPEPDPSLDPAHLNPGNLLYACDHWYEDRPLPSGKRIFADVMFSIDSRHEPTDRPQPNHRLRVLRFGGTILYTFHLPAYRISILTDSVPKLAETDRVVVMDVPDARRYDRRILIQYKPSDPVGERQTSRFAELGGRVLDVFRASNGLAGVLPDRSIAALRRDSGVEIVVVADIGCLQ